jgi:hypothetical protein
LGSPQARSAAGWPRAVVEAISLDHRSPAGANCIRRGRNPYFT